MFGKSKIKCGSCNSKIDKNFSYCPHCGNITLDQNKEREEFGLLGKNDFSNTPDPYGAEGFGITDRLIGSMFNSLMKNLDKQMKSQFKESLSESEHGRTEIKTLPNGIRIKIFGPNNFPQNKKVKQAPRITINEDQIKKMSSLPRAKAKTNVKRVGDKVFYELSTPGVSSPQDIFISKLESGYEIKAIGNKKVYVNSVPINLPLKRYSILNNKLLVEFNAGNDR